MSEKKRGRTKETDEGVRRQSKTLHQKYASGELVPWNKGKTGIYSDDTLQQMSENRKGYPPWNKGKTNVYSEEMLERMS